jgi:hypothetical protein
VTARDRLVAALGGLELMPGSILRLTGRAAERIADLAVQVLAEEQAPGDEERDRLRRERDDARRVLAELLQACDVLRTRATPTTVRAHREHVDEARRYLDRAT